MAWLTSHRSNFVLDAEHDEAAVYKTERSVKGGCYGPLQKATIVPEQPSGAHGNLVDRRIQDVDGHLRQPINYDRSPNPQHHRSEDDG